MRLLELLELVDAGGDGGRVLRRVGDHLAIGVVLRALIRGGVDVFAGRVVCLPAGEWLSDIEAHADGEVVMDDLKRTGAVTRRGAATRRRGEGGAGDLARARSCSVIITGRTGTPSGLPVRRVLAGRAGAGCSQVRPGQGAASSNSSNSSSRRREEETIKAAWLQWLHANGSVASNMPSPAGMTA